MGKTLGAAVVLGCDYDSYSVGHADVCIAANHRSKKWKACFVHRSLQDLSSCRRTMVTFAFLSSHPLSRCAQFHPLVCRSGFDTLSVALIPALDDHTTKGLFVYVTLSESLHAVFQSIAGAWLSFLITYRVSSIINHEPTRLAKAMLICIRTFFRPVHRNEARLGRHVHFQQ